ncbi:hypothetical protein ABIA53_005185 [Pseudomonas monsensis]
MKIGSLSLHSRRERGLTVVFSGHTSTRDTQSNSGLKGMKIGSLTLHSRRERELTVVFSGHTST